MKPGLPVGLALVCSVLAYGQAVTTYTASTDSGIRNKPPLPALGRAGSWIVDPAFKSRIVRLTDPYTLPGYYQNRSFTSSASAEQNTWNANSTIFLVVMSGGWTVPFAFDPATLAVSRMGDLSNKTGGLVLTSFGGTSFSFTDPRLLYGVSGTSIAQYDFSTGVTTPLLRLDTLVAGAGRRVGEVSVSVDEKLSTYFGGSAQDTDCYVVVFNKATGQTTILDTLRSTIDGKPASATLGWTIHNARLDKSGRYVVITAVNGYLTVWDTQTGALTSAPSYGKGHKAAGFGDMVNSDAFLGEYGPQWLYRSLNTAGINQPTPLLNPNPVGPWWGVDNHLSWNNDPASGTAPVLISTYRDSRTPAPLTPLEDEIIAVRTAGGPTVWRFAHHRSVYAGNFWDSPRGNVSQDGRFFLFTSNWEKALGLDSSGTPRRDAFIVELTPPVLQVSPPSAVLSAGQTQQFTVSGNTGLPVTWSLSPNVGSISATGVYSAPLSIPANQTVTVIATGSLHGQSAEAKVSLLASAGTVFSPIRVNAGGPDYTDTQGHYWSADMGYIGGSTWQAQISVSNTSDPQLYKSARRDRHSYHFVVPNGSYQVNLKFAEVNQTAAGKRLFNVALNGTPALSNFDIFAASGGFRIALEKPFPVTVTDNQILIQLTPGLAGNPIISAIEVVAAGATTSGNPSPPPAFTPIRVNAGGPDCVDAQGRLWKADTGYDWGGVWKTSQTMSNTDTPSLYQTVRYGVGFRYQFAVPDGTYQVKLKFAEVSQTAAGKRLFNVALNGAPILTNFDIFAAAGGAFIALDKSFPVTVSGGQILLQFTAGLANSPMVNAIEIVAAGATTGGNPSPPPAFTPIRVNAGGPDCVDAQGRLWKADTGYDWGGVWKTSQTMSNTDTPSLYQTVRYGVGFRYQFAVPDGAYQVKLKFAEVSQTAAGKRLFNVALNGAPILTNFDIFAAAGGAFIALDKSFPVTVSGGQILLQFTAGLANSPMVNAIEIAQ